MSDFRRRSTALLALVAVVPLTGCTIPTDRGARDVTTTVVTSTVDPSPTAGAEEVRGTLGAVIAAVEGRFGGEAGVAFADGRHAGTLQTEAAWSTSKVPLVLAAERAGVADPDLVAAAITRSDNEAARALWRKLGGGQEAATALETEIVKITGSSPTVPVEPSRHGFTPFGQTPWSLAEQAEFMQGLPGHENAETVLAPMRRVIAAQSFGLGTVPGAAFKGGWGPRADGTYIVRQMGLVNGTGVAIMAHPADGTFETGQAMLTDLAGRLEL